MKLTEEQKRDAYAILQGVPANRMTPSLGSIFNKQKPDVHACGTLACGAGWLSLHPSMKDKIHSISEVAYGLLLYNVDLFDFRGGSCRDRDLLRKSPNMNDKQLLLGRILLGLGWSLDKAVKKARVDGAQ